ncbi:hypothetical protein [Scytonema hofmannii]|nr:hypothetical protein [Scytonema hofmannii]
MSQTLENQINALVNKPIVAFVETPESKAKPKQNWFIGEHIRKQHLVWRIDPHCSIKEYQGIAVWGRPLDYKQAAIGIRQWINLLKERMQRRGDALANYETLDDFHLHLAIGSLQNYVHMINEIEPNLIAEFWNSAIAFAPLVNMSLSFCCDRNFGRLLVAKGRLLTFMEATTWIHCYASSDDKYVGHANYVTYEDKDRISKPFHVPEWMHCCNSDFTGLISEHCPHFLYNPGS